MTSVRLAAIALVLTVVAACSPPITAPSGEEGDAFSAGLGETSNPLMEGIYFLGAFTDPEDGMERVEGPFPPGDTDDFPRPDLSLYHLVLWDEASGSYATSFANLRFYSFDGEHFVAEVRFTNQPDENNSYFFPARVSRNGDRLTLLFLDCSSIPENYRAAQGFDTSNCEAPEPRVMLRAFGLVDFSDLGTIIFDRVGELPRHLR